jgi:fatty-acyl-CoA synthase/long-chain acyl-CoA synthetase
MTDTAEGKAQTAQPPAPFTMAYYAQETPEKEALTDGRTRLTYADCSKLVNKTANALADLGIGRGDRVAVLMYNSLESYIGGYAVGKLKANSVPVGYRLKSNEIEYIVNNSQAKALIMGSEFEGVVGPVIEKFENVTPDRILVNGPGISFGTRLEDKIEPASDIFIESDQEETGSSIIYTSGTTGRPKGAFRGNRPRDLELLMAIISNFRVTSDDRHIVTCPLYHSAPPVFAGLHSILGAFVYVMKKFDPEQFLKIVEEEQISSTFMVPTMLNMVANLPDDVKKKYNLESMKNLVVGGAPFPMATKKAIIELFPSECLFEFYGSTELGINTILLPEEQLERAGSCGRAFGGNEIILLDEDRKPVKQGEVGEFFAKNSMLVDGYFRNKQATDDAFHGDYMSVGDMAYMDEGGYYYIVDRKKDMVISGGVNIYPAEIEIVLNDHPKVFDSAVIGIPDEQWGESLKAFIVLKAGQEATAEEMIEYCGENLARYKKPKYVEFLPELPRNPSGKLLKKQLRDV